MKPLRDMSEEELRELALEAAAKRGNPDEVAYKQERVRKLDRVHLLAYLAEFG